MLDVAYLERVAHYFESGDCKFEFDNGEEDRKLLILDFLEHLMDLANRPTNWLPSSSSRMPMPR